ncbi:MAG: ribonuclease P protein component [Planctomycetota bacterium]|jgi:ribonuclease P protein component
MMRRFCFPRRARILRKRDFQHVYRTGRRLGAFPLRLCALRRREGKSRLGLAVSRKVGGAVLRNRWKRAIREAFRLNRHRLLSAYDMVVSVDWEASGEDVSRVAACFDQMIDTLNAAGTEEAQ